MLLHQIAEYGATEATSTLSNTVRHHAKRAILDWFAALYPGTRLSPGKELIRAYEEEIGIGSSRIVGFNTTATMSTAAWINGSVSHSAEFDDIYREAIYHPGCPVIAAALAVAENKNLSGSDLMRSIVIGYEISTRIGAAIQPSHYHYFHTTGTVGCIGSAAAVAALCAPGNAIVMQHAIATATTFASGLQQAFRSDAMTKSLHAGHAAAIGVRAGLAAAAGVTGVVDILEGEVGFASAMAENVDWNVAIKGLGSNYNITKITQKNHGCCGHTFSAIDAALILKNKNNLSIENIRAIYIATYQTAIQVTGNFVPTTAFEAKFSLPYVVSHALHQGSVRLQAFEKTSLEDPVTRGLMTKITLTEDPALSALFPHNRSARVTIETHDGNRFSHHASNRKGDPENPLTDTELNDKFSELVSPLLGQALSEQLKSQIWRLDTLRLRELHFS